MVVIVDYGMGNLNSIANMLKKIRVDGMISSDPAVIRNASKLILPGVGAFNSGMKNLRERGLVPVLEEKVIQQKTPILGICLGMHLFTGGSEEGETPGLGWIDSSTVKFEPYSSGRKLRVPHMGWNTVEIKKDSIIFDKLTDEARFYFVHSYYVKCNTPSDALTVTRYGETFTSAFSKDNIFGVQFHPEKSHRFGMQLLTNFGRLPDA